MNILTGTLTVEEAEGVLRLRRPVLPPVGDAVWTKAARRPLTHSLFAPVREKARAERQQPLPPLTDALYAEFHRTGRRTAFQEVYFRRRQMLGRAAMDVLLSTEQERPAALPSLVEKLRGVFREESWALPAHVGSPTGKDPRNLDLFACETASLMGEMLAVFGPLLPEPLAQDIRARLRDTIFHNYLDNHEALGWTRAAHNWNAVCHQGILGAALSAEEEPALVARLLCAARACLPHFLTGFGADGGCSEGPGYWQYGFGWFSVLNEQLETASGGRLSLFDGDAHVHEIALFYPRATFSNGYLINFSDAPARGTPNPRLLCYLGKRLDDDLLRACGDNAWRTLLQAGIDLEEHRCDFFYLARLLRDGPDAVPAEAALPHTDFYFQDLEVLTAQRRDAEGRLWEFAAKGGHNAEHHNHNDGGSFILHVDGQPFVTEIGAPEYCKEYFTARRYENLAARTRGHSLPLVNGHEQAAGQESAARVLAHDLTPTSVRFVLDLTECYPPDAHCRSLVRTFFWDMASGTLSVSDEYELAQAGTMETAIITHQAVQQDGSDVLICSQAGRLRVRPSPGTQIAAVTEHSYNNHQGEVVNVRRIVLTPVVSTQRGRAEYSFFLVPNSTVFL